MKKILLLAIIYIACFANAKAYFPPDSCLQVVPPQYDDNGKQFVFNPDSLMWDTCDENINHIRYFYGKGEYRISFKYNVIPRNFVATTDSSVYYTLSDILPAYSELKDSLISLSASLGTFTIVDQYTSVPDTLAGEKRYLNFIFNKIHTLQKTCDSLVRLPFILSASPIQYVNFITGGVKNLGDSDYFRITPNPAKYEILINLKGQLPPKEIQIVDEKGHLVLQTDFKEKINISNLSSGVYFVKINNQIQKFIKE